MTFVPWRVATQEALYGPRGFFRRPDGPAGAFRTSVHASALFAGAVLRLADDYAVSEIVDMGSGRGELLRALAAMDAPQRLRGIDVVSRPEGLPARITWEVEGAEPFADRVLVLANEWLDDVPVDVAERTEDGWALVLVDPRTGAERSGPPVSPADAAWLDRWSPATTVGARAEIGLPRDAAWASLLQRIGDGVAIAVDYAHTLSDRASERYPLGTLAGYRDGRLVPPVPDGSCDITAHVALDACAEAGRAVGATSTVLTTQRQALQALGVSGARPPASLATSDPLGYVRALAAAGEAAELTDPAGLGGFTWLVQTKGALPSAVSVW